MKKKKIIRQAKSLYETWVDTLDPQEFFDYIYENKIPEHTTKEYYDLIKKEYLDNLSKILEKV